MFTDQGNTGLGGDRKSLLQTMDDLGFLISQGERPLKFLVVEDDEANRLYVETLLRKLNIQVILANNGQEAIELFPREKFDCVLMDIQMPVMDGFAAAKTIRLLEEQNNDTPVTIVAFTAYVYHFDIEKISRAGMDDYISKPVSAYELCYWVKSWYENRTRLLKQKKS